MAPKRTAACSSPCGVTAWVRNTRTFAAIRATVTKGNREVGLSSRSGRNIGCHSRPGRPQKKNALPGGGQGARFGLGRTGSARLLQLFLELLALGGPLPEVLELVHGLVGLGVVAAFLFRLELGHHAPIENAQPGIRLRV